MKWQAGSEALSEPSAQISSALAIPFVLSKFGIGVADVLKAVGLDPNLFHDPGNRISHAARVRMVSESVARTGCRHFGLLIGRQSGLRGYGLVGLLAMHSPDVGTALRNFSRYLHVHTRGVLVSLAVVGDRAVLGYGTHHQPGESADHVSDAAIAMLFSVLGDLCGPDWKPTEVTFMHSAPANAGPYRSLFRAPVTFDAPLNAIVFPALWLARRLPRADPELFRLLQAQVDAIAASHGDDLVEQVRTLLHAALVTDYGTEDQVAALLVLPTRTLRRRLSERGTTFRELVNECQYENARQLLEHSSQSLAAIAACLDYAEVRPFNRAFRRWSGMTPAQWRATVKGAGLDTLRGNARR